MGRKEILNILISFVFTDELSSVLDWKKARYIQYCSFDIFAEFRSVDRILVEQISVGKCPDLRKRIVYKFISKSLQNRRKGRKESERVACEMN